MKKTLLNLFGFISLLALNTSCDFVNDANPPLTPSNSGSSSGGSSGGSGIGTPIVYRKVLVEDYTGHKCGNCPAAADELKTLETQYSGKIVPLAIHAGFFANTNATYPTNLKSTAGTAYDTQFGISAAGNPNGLVNRVGYGAASFIKAYTSWGTEVYQMISQTAKFQIKIKNTFNSSTNSLNTDVTVKSLASNLGTYKLVVLLSEDSIVAEQLDYRKPTGQQLIPDYEFNHVLRGAINSEWGDPIFLSGAAANDSVVKSYNNFSINTSYRPAKCHVIAYVYDAASSSPTYYEILQVEEKHVK